MQVMKPKNFDHLIGVEWFNQVSEMNVKLQEMGSRQGRVTTFNLRPDLNQSVYNILEGEGIIKSSSEIEEQINSTIQTQVERFIEKRIDKYKKGVKIHNQLVDLNVKDKRKWDCGEAYEGKIKPTELVSNIDYRENIAYMNPRDFTIHFHCPYDYNFSSDAEQRYKYKEEECIVKGGTFDLELELTFKYDGKKSSWAKEDDKVWNIPDPKLFYNLTNHDNQIKKICLINTCDVDSKWDRKTGTHKDTLKFQSAPVHQEYRKVGLNTFIIYCRERSQHNRDNFLREVQESVNEQDMMKILASKFGEENLSRVQGYENDINFNNNSYWGRYSTSVLKVMLSDESFLYYDYTTMVKDKRLELIGLYDSTYTKETTKSAYQRVMDNNNQDTFGQYDFEEMNKKNK